MLTAYIVTTVILFTLAGVGNAMKISETHKNVNLHLGGMIFNIILIVWGVAILL